MVLRRHLPYDLVSNLPGGDFISFCKGLVAEWNMALDERLPIILTSPVEGICTCQQNFAIAFGSLAEGITTTSVLYNGK
jgi:hypothetical protein